MKRLTFSEKKALAIKFIAKIAEGYRLTGPNNAFKEATAGIEPVGIQQSSLYQFIRADDELSQAYFQARDSQRKNVLSGSRQLGVNQRVKLIELIIANISQGMNIRGDVYRENAVVAACESLELPIVHWATIHRWLRVEHKDLRDSFKKAMAFYSKIHAEQLKHAKDAYRVETGNIDRECKENIARARKMCNESISAAKLKREEDLKNAKLKKSSARKAAREKYQAAIKQGKAGNKA